MGAAQRRKSFWAFDLFMLRRPCWLYRSLEVQQGPALPIAPLRVPRASRSVRKRSGKDTPADEAEFFLIGGRADLIKNTSN